MLTPLRVLIVEDCEDDAELMRQELRRAGFEPQSICVQTEEKYLEHLRLELDVVLSDCNMPHFDAARALALLQERQIDLPLIVVSGSIGEEKAVELLKAGAVDYILKDRMARLGEAVRRALEQQRLRRENRAAQDRLHLLERTIEALGEGVLITDAEQPERPIIYANPAFFRLTGYTPAEVHGRNWRLLHGPATNSAALAEINAAIASGRSCQVELLNYRKDSSTFWNSLSISPIRQASGRITHYVAILVDVTRRRNLEEQYRQAQKMEAMGQLAGGVAHDFNNVLTVIAGYSEMLLQQWPDPAAGSEMVREVARAADRAAGLTRQLLAFSRKQVLTPNILNLNSVVVEFEKMLRRMIDEDIHLVLELEPNVGSIKADQGQMEQVILNLVINARDAMPEGGRITIRTANSDRCEGHDRPILPVTPGRFVQLAVSDTGMGIDPAVRPLIFEPFFTTKGARGTGLGLATVYAIVEQNGGHICLSSEIGKGTAFEVCFPRVEAERPVSKSRPSQAGMVRGSQTVLLVEDEEAVRGLVRQILLGAGYNVLESPDGAQALQLAEQHLGPIHLLVTDVVLPGVGGRMVAERLMALRPTMRILFLSGYTDDAVLRRGVDQADANFLQKPFTSADLLKKVAEILQ